MSRPVRRADPARTLDKFYTNPAIVDRCLASLRTAADDLASHDLWIEPSAGAGAFLSKLPTPKLGLDIAPESDSIVQADFLLWSPDDHPASQHARNPIIVGNPPFGKNASLAVAFFNHAATMANRIAFVVPRTFEKASLQARLNTDFHLDLSETLPLDGFTLQGEPYAVPCAWQVWTRRAMPLKRQRRVLTHPDFAFVGRGEADLAFQRVGVRAGTVKDSFSHVADASHLFIRAVGLSPRLLSDRLAALDFSAVRNSTAGNPSISKSELVDAYDRAHKAYQSAATP